MHAPEEECINKGKSRKLYEFGCRVSVVTTAYEQAVFYRANNVRLLYLGQSNFEAINRWVPPPFRELLNVAMVPSSEWLRQRERGLSGQ